MNSMNDAAPAVKPAAWPQAGPWGACRRLLLANVTSMVLQGTVLAALCSAGVDAWLSLAIAKAASWTAFGVQLSLPRLHKS